jgi:hypothetical protein
MEFKAASIDGISYGFKTDKTVEKDKLPEIPCDFNTFNPKFVDPEFKFYDSALLDAISSKCQRVKGG